MDVSTKIDIIVSASYIFDVPSTSKCSEPFILLQYPDLKHRMIATCMYNKAVAKAETAGLLSKKKLNNMLMERGVFKDSDLKREEFLKKQIKAQKTLLSRMKFSKTKIEQLKVKIEKMEVELSNFLTTKESYLMNTSDAMAAQEKLDYLVWASLFYLDGTRIWDSFNLYMAEKDLVFKGELYTAALEFLYGFDTKELRYIARHPEWRIRYTSFLKGNFKLFGTDPKNYTKDQLGLLHWSNYYQSIYDMMPDDRPDDAIIEDDEKLDKYMDEYFKAIEQDRKVRQASNKGSDAFDRDEVIVTRFSGLYEDLEYDDVKPRESSSTGVIKGSKVKR